MVVIKVFKRAYFSDLVYFASIVEGFNQVSIVQKMVTPWPERCRKRRYPGWGVTFSGIRAGIGFFWGLEIL